MAKNRLVSICVAVTFFCMVMLPTNASATGDFSNISLEGELRTLNVGDPAPFSGTLFSTDAASSLLVRLQSQEDYFKLRLDKELSLRSNELQLRISILEMQLKSKEDTHTQILQVRQAQINRLQELAQDDPWYEAPEFWLVIGVISGIAITVAAGYAVGQAAPSPSE